MDGTAVSYVCDGETTHRYLVHDRDCIYSPAVDGAPHAMGRQVLKSPVMAPQANAHCERVIGTARRDYLDWVIPLDERLCATC
jgi:putative transposase